MALQSTSIPPVAPVRTRMTQLSSSTIPNAPSFSSDNASPGHSPTALIAVIAALTTAPSTIRMAAPLSTLPNLSPPTKVHSIGHSASVPTVGYANSPLLSPPSGISEAFNWSREQAQRSPAPFELPDGIYFQLCQSPVNVLPMGQTHGDLIF